MRNILLGVMFLALVLLPQRSSSAGEKGDEIKAKIKAVQKQLEELRKQEHALLKQLELEDSYVKVEAEVKGVLRYEDICYPPIIPKGESTTSKGWTITAFDDAGGRRRELTLWHVTFDDKLLEMAKTNDGKTVTLKGTPSYRSFTTFDRSCLPPCVLRDTKGSREIVAGIHVKSLVAPKNN